MSHSNAEGPPRAAAAAPSAAAGALPEGAAGPGVPADAAPSGDAPAAHHLAVEARFGELYVLFMRNLLLSIATLSFYRFWGRARIRRYIWSRVSFAGDAFEYSGTGRELLRGFLAAFAIVGVPLIVLAVVSDLPGEALILITFAVLWLLRHFAKFGAHRYRMSRTHWRGIAGSVDGSALKYGAMGIGFDLLLVVSLGWTKPWSDTVLLNYRLRRSWAGAAPARGALGVSGLYARYFMSWLAVAGGFGCISYLIAENAAVVASFDMIFLETVLLYLVLPVIWTLGMGIYNIGLLRKAARAVRIGELAFTLNATGWQLARFRLANYFILIGTAGLGLPYILLRQVRFAARHLEIAGPAETLVLEQRPGRRIRGEGLAQYLGLDNF